MNKEDRKKAFLRYLRDTYKVFAEPLPMAIGIKAEVRRRHEVPQESKALEDLAEGEERHGMIQAALEAQSSTRLYLEKIAEGGPRYDLDGNPCGEVTKEQQEHARQILDKRKQAAAKKRKAKNKEARQGQ